MTKTRDTSIARVVHALHVFGAVTGALSLVAVAGLLTGGEYLADKVTHRGHHGG